MKRVDFLFRRLAPVLSAGVLVQTNGCATDLSTLAPEFISTIASALINNLVFGAFNLV